MNKSIFWSGLTIVIIAIIIGIVFFNVNYSEKEGFNPTDEGVVLAQSWRLLNGEVAHKDFISIRPIGSGIFHSVNFSFPGHLIVNARWFVLFQFYTIAIVMSLICFKFLSEKFRNLTIPLFIALLLSTFFLTVLNYNLYSWTTIDAVFWSVLSVPFILKGKKTFNNTIGLIFLCFAAVSRQTFAILVIAGYIYLFFQYRKNLVKAIPVFITGALPLLLYFIYLLYHSALSDFLQQMTGRTEFFQTAILQFLKKLVVSNTSALNLVCLFVTIILYLKRKSGLQEMFIKKGFHTVFAIIYIIFSFALIIKYFFAQEQDILSLPFELFFMLAFMGLFHLVLLPESKTLRKITIFVLLISWISAISLGDNTPVFATGILFVCLLTICLDIALSKLSKFSKLISNQWLILTISIIISASGFYSQQKFNYRDNPSDKIVKGLNYASSEFGDILTNTSLIAYYSDLKDIFDTLPESKNNTIVFPHNAIFYPVMETNNPMSLDWLIANEYIGQEQRVLSDLKNLKTSTITYFFVDRIDLRIIKDGISPRFYEDDIVYDFILENCTKLTCQSEFIDVYKL